MQRWHLDKEGTSAMDVKHSHGKAMELPAVEVVFAPEIQVSSCVFFSSGNPGCLRHGGFRPEIPKRWRFWDSWDLQKPKGSPWIFKEFLSSEGFMLMFIESTWITWKVTGLDFHLKSPQKVNNLNHYEWSQAFCSGKKLLMHWCTCTSYMQLWSFWWHLRAVWYNLWSWFICWNWNC